MFDISQVVLYLYLVYFTSLITYFYWKSKLSSTVLVIFFSSILFGLIVCYFYILLQFFFSIYLDFSSQNFIYHNINNFLSFSLNPLSFFFSFLVILIGFSTNIYILNYFKHEADESLFIFWLNSFILSMVILVLGSNFYTIFLGWELIGLTSFFLINFWSSRRGTLKSSFKAFTFNLASDIFLLTSFVCFYKEYNTTDCDTFLYLIYNSTNITDTITCGSFALLLCASIKSVQIISHIWLPDSMEAPVPASALIHSATLVSAGIYLICKFNILFIILNWTSLLIFLGSFTACYGGVVAASQTDLKKLLAYSTMSHCGFLWVLASLGNFYITILYLFLHGLFKASTFYCVGSFIYQFGSQDSRVMGSTAKNYLLDSILLILTSMNLSGLPFTIGYIYKLYFFKLLTDNLLNTFSITLLLFGMLSSIIYFFRIVYYTIFDYLKLTKNSNINYLQQIKFDLASKVHITNWNNLISILTVLFTAYCVSYCFIFFINYNFEDLNFDYIFYFNMNKLSIIFIFYFFIFYFFYVFIIYIILLLNWRKNIFFNENVILSIYLLLVILLICEVI